MARRGLALEHKLAGSVYTPSALAERLAEATLGAHAAAGATMWPRLLDPACGDGELLVAALRWLARHHGDDAPLNELVRRCIVGIDVDPDAVQAARDRLAALGVDPRVAADAVGVGDPLVGDDDVARELGLEPFAWDAIGGPTFDVVIANPPFVRIQHVRKSRPQLAAYLRRAQIHDGHGVSRPLYPSASRGTYDLYLVFIELGLDHLAAHGHLGVLAPTGWVLDEQGAQLRRRLVRRRELAQFFDFGDRQQFEGAVSYVGLQLFSARPCEEITYGSLSAAGDRPTAEASFRIPYDELSAACPWLLAPEAERCLIRRLREGSDRLDQVASIHVGVQTSADDVFHLDVVGDGRYATRRFARRVPRELPVEIEPGILRPLVSGTDARAYTPADPKVRLIFPYVDEGDATRLLEPDEFRSRHPLAWAHLSRYEALLRAREGGKFDDPRWYRFGRRQNVDKQRRPKLLVPRMTKRLQASIDPTGAACIDNVDVNGVFVDDETERWFLLGVLNGPVAHYFWRRFTRPFEHGYFAANRQFIGSVPVPRVDRASRAQIAEFARARFERAEAGMGASDVDDGLTALLLAAYGLSVAEQELIVSDRHG